MEFTIGRAAFIVAIAGIASYTLGISAEVWRMPPSIPEQLKDGKFKCIYPNDQSAYYGFAALLAVFVAALIGSLHKYHSLNGVKAPVDAYGHHTGLKVFFLLAMFMEALAFYMIFQPLYTVHRLRNITYNHPIKMCPTADRGVVAGGALSSLGASLLWLIVFIFAKNCREDFLRGSDANSSVGSYGLIEEEFEAGPW